MRVGDIEHEVSVFMWSLQPLYWLTACRINTLDLLTATVQTHLLRTRFLWLYKWRQTKWSADQIILLANFVYRQFYCLEALQSRPVTKRWPVTKRCNVQPSLCKRSEARTNYSFPQQIAIPRYDFVAIKLHEKRRVLIYSIFPTCSIFRPSGCGGRNAPNRPKIF